MAGSVLLTISKDEVERARIKSEYKYAVDLQSKLIDARKSERKEIAKNLLAIGMSSEQIAGAKGLTVEEVSNLAEHI